MAKPSSIYGYCPVHDHVATDHLIFAEALKGHAGAALKEFCKEVELGIYPSKIW